MLRPTAGSLASSEDGPRRRSIGLEYLGRECARRRAPLRSFVVERDHRGPGSGERSLDTGRHKGNDALVQRESPIGGELTMTARNMASSGAAASRPAARATATKGRVWRLASCRRAACREQQRGVVFAGKIDEMKERAVVRVARSIFHDQRAGRERGRNLGVPQGARGDDARAGHGRPYHGKMGLAGSFRPDERQRIGRPVGPGANELERIFVGRPNKKSSPHSFRRDRARARALRGVATWRLGRPVAAEKALERSARLQTVSAR